jgi:hypothetical protein
MLKKVRTFALVVLCGGMLFQTSTSCESIIAPIISSLISSVVNSAISGALAGI